jgi:hypothetical protein
MHIKYEANTITQAKHTNSPAIESSVGPNIIACKNVSHAVSIASNNSGSNILFPDISLIIDDTAFSENDTLLSRSSYMIGRGNFL